MSRFSITLPLPPSELRVNRRMGEHWGAYHKAQKRYRRDCDAVLLLKAPKDVDESRWQYPVSMRAVLYLGKWQRVDPSDAGSWIKTAIDCLVAWRILPDDGYRYINPFTVEVKRDLANPRLEISW